MPGSREGPIVMLAPYWSIDTVLAFGAGPFALRDFE